MRKLSRIIAKNLEDIFRIYDLLYRLRFSIENDHFHFRYRVKYTRTGVFLEESSIPH